MSRNVRLLAVWAMLLSFPALFSVSAVNASNATASPPPGAPGSVSASPPPGAPGSAPPPPPAGAPGAPIPPIPAEFPMNAPDDAGKLHVLLLHPFTPDDPAHVNYNAGLIGELGKHPQHEFTYSYEYFDYALHSNEPTFFELMADYLKIKYRDHPPDLDRKSVV